MSDYLSLPLRDLDAVADELRVEAATARDEARRHDGLLLHADSPEEYDRLSRAFDEWDERAAKAEDHLLIVESMLARRTRP